MSGYAYELDGGNQWLPGNRVSAVETLTGTRTIAYTYDPLNRLTEATYSDPSAGSGQAGEQFAYTHDAAGNVARITDASNGSQQQNFGYDALDRLIAASTNGVAAASTTRHTPTTPSAT